MNLSKYALSALLLVTVGCNQTQEDAWDTYVSRLSSALQVTPTKVEPLEFRIPPISVKEDIKTSSISLVELWDIKHCELHQTIANRNSNLGRLRVPSQEWVYAMNFIALAPNCIQSLSNNEVSVTLQDAFEEKRRQLPTLASNVVFAGDEWRSFWQAMTFNASHPTEGVMAFSQLASNLINQNTLSSEQLESLLATIYHSNAGGTLLVELSNERRYLRVAIQTLHDVEQLQYCPRGTAARQLSGLIGGYYNTEVQSYSAETHRNWGTLIAALEQLRQLPKSESLDSWLVLQGQRLQETKLLHEQHAQLLSELFERCDISLTMIE